MKYASISKKCTIILQQLGRENKKALSNQFDYNVSAKQNKMNEYKVCSKLSKLVCKYIVEVKGNILNVTF
jgi:hypothetical protein